jgi:hypothetical protein
MNNPVLKAITELLSHKGHCTYSELASVSGVKKIRVLEILNANKTLIAMSHNKIVRLRDYSKIEIKEACEKGLTFWEELGNYGTDKTLVTKNEKAKALETPAYYGGFGDSYRVERIEDTEENRKKLIEMGIVHYKDYPTKTTEEVWIE